MVKDDLTELGAVIAIVIVAVLFIVGCGVLMEISVAADMATEARVRGL